MKLASISKVYCVGLGGVGVSAIAKYFLHQGVVVMGSDPGLSPLLDDVRRLGGRCFRRPDPRRITADIDVLVYTDACPPDHPELLAAATLNIPRLNFAQMLGLIMQRYAQRITITGTNGKSTTSALTGLLCQVGELEPTVFVGSRVSQYDGNLHLGQGQTMVVEADEYRDHFLHLAPTILTITNIELDHVDYFPTLDRVRQSFQNMFALLPPDGHCLVNADDPICQQDFVGHPQVISYGFAAESNIHIEGWRSAAGGQTFSIRWRDKVLGPYQLPLPGKFNVSNAVAAVATALVAGADPTNFSATIANFRGVWRRFEILSQTNDRVTVVNDYAHHPTAVELTIEGARQFFPGRRIVVAFQPHHANRLAALYDHFLTCFDGADFLVLTELYAVLGREQELPHRTSRELSQDLLQRGVPVMYAESVLATQQVLQKNIRPGDVVIIMGAGDIWTIASQLAHHDAAT